MTETDPTLPDICAAILSAPVAGKRRLVALAGAPASGKSTFAEKIAGHLTAQGHNTQVVPMDGFHLDNADLDLRGLRSRKGAPETFDVAGLTDLVARLGTRDEVSFPAFDRSNDRSVPDAGALSHGVQTVIVEGNYLLFDDKGWRDLYDLWDFRIFLNVPPDVLRARLVDRWLAHDHTQAQAETRADSNDMANARRLYAHRLPCDLEVTLAGPAA